MSDKQFHRTSRFKKISAATLMINLASLVVAVVAHDISLANKGWGPAFWLSSTFTPNQLAAGTAVVAFLSARALLAKFVE